MLQATWRDAEGLDTLINEWPINLPRRSDVNTYLAVGEPKAGPLVSAV